MKKIEESFLTPQDHFALLLKGLNAESREAYSQTRHARQEMAYRGRTFILYEMTGRSVHRIVDTLTIRDFECDDAVGASTQIRSGNLGAELEISYLPVKLWNYPVFMHLPVHLKLRWSTSEKRIGEGSLAFPLVIRVNSRLDPREPGILHCETGVAYAHEFEGDAR